MQPVYLRAAKTSALGASNFLQSYFPRELAADHHRDSHRTRRSVARCRRCGNDRSKQRPRLSHYRRAQRRQTLRSRRRRDGHDRIDRAGPRFLVRRLENFDEVRWGYANK